jgi:hypothetical protein
MFWSKKSGTLLTSLAPQEALQNEHHCKTRYMCKVLVELLTSMNSEMANMASSQKTLLLRGYN